MPQYAKMPPRFSEKQGFLSATLVDVASAAGTSKGSIFQLFTTKDELLFQILYRYHKLAMAQLKQELNSSNSACEKIYIYISSGVNIARTVLLICPRPSYGTCGHYLGNIYGFGNVGGSKEKN